MYAAEEQREYLNKHPEESAIAVTGLRKSFRDKAVLRDVSFYVPRGITYALLGSNGAGKTTTIRILTTQLKADGGEVRIAGFDAGREAERIHEVISLTGQFAAVDDALTGKENLMVIAKLRQIASPEIKAEELLEAFGLSGAASQMVSSYSGGMKRRLDIAMSLLGEPEIIFLDEPTTGLDPQSRRVMWDMVRELNKKGITIFLTTQYLEEAEQLADRIAILDRGRIIAEGSAEELKAYLPHGALKFIFAGGEGLKKAEMLLDGYQMSSLPEEQTITVYTDGRADIAGQIFSLLYQNNISIADFSQITPNLEDVFLTMIEEREEDFHGSQSKKI